MFLATVEGLRILLSWGISQLCAYRELEKSFSAGRNLQTISIPHLTKPTYPAFSAFKYEKITFYL